jgi:hypothetical protein
MRDVEISQKNFKLLAKMSFEARARGLARLERPADI